MQVILLFESGRWRHDGDNACKKSCGRWLLRTATDQFFQVVLFAPFPLHSFLHCRPFERADVAVCNAFYARLHSDSCSLLQLVGSVSASFKAVIEMRHLDVSS